MIDVAAYVAEAECQARDDSDLSVRVRHPGRRHRLEVHTGRQKDMPIEEVGARASQMQGAINFPALAGCSLVVEAAYESIGVT